MARIYTKVFVSFKTPGDLDSTYTHVADSQDVLDIMEDFNLDPDDRDFRSFFVKIADGAYVEVLGCCLAYNVLWSIERIYE